MCLEALEERVVPWAMHYFSGPVLNHVAVEAVFLGKQWYDEPLASLDPLARREFLGVLVEAVRATGATALLSSHVITDIEQACDQLIALPLRGKVQSLGVSAAAAAILYEILQDR